MINLPLGESEAWNMYMRMIFLLLVGLVAFGRNVSSDVDNTSTSTRPSTSAETCSSSTEFYSSSSSSSSRSSSSSFSAEDSLATKREMFYQTLRMNAISEDLQTIVARYLALRPFPETFTEYRLYGRVSALESKHVYYAC